MIIWLYHVMLNPLDRQSIVSIITHHTLMCMSHHTVLAAPWSFTIIRFFLKLPHIILSTH